MTKFVLECGVTPVKSLWCVCVCFVVCIYGIVCVLYFSIGICIYYYVFLVGSGTCWEELGHRRFILVTRDKFFLCVVVCCFSLFLYIHLSSQFLGGDDRTWRRKENVDTGSKQGW